MSISHDLFTSVPASNSICIDIFIRVQIPTNHFFYEYFVTKSRIFVNNRIHNEPFFFIFATLLFNVMILKMKVSI